MSIASARTCLSRSCSWSVSVLDELSVYVLWLWLRGQGIRWPLCGFLWHGRWRCGCWMWRRSAHRRLGTVFWGWDFTCLHGLVRASLEDLRISACIGGGGGGGGLDGWTWIGDAALARWPGWWWHVAAFPDIFAVDIDGEEDRLILLRWGRRGSSDGLALVCSYGALHLPHFLLQYPHASMSHTYIHDLAWFLDIVLVAIDVNRVTYVGVSKLTDVQLYTPSVFDIEYLNNQMQSGTVLGHIYLSLVPSYCSTQWPVACPALCIIVFLS